MKNITKKDLLDMKCGTFSNKFYTDKEVMQELASYILSLTKTLDDVWLSVEDIIGIDPDELEREARADDDSEKNLLRQCQQELKNKWEHLAKEYELR